QPTSVGRPGNGGDGRGMAGIENGMRAVLTAVIAGDRLRQVCLWGRPISEEGMGPSQRVVRLQEEARVLRALRQVEQLLCQIQPRLDFPAHDAEETYSP